MYRENEPSAMFHTLHRAHRKRVSAAQSSYALDDLGSPMLLICLSKAERRGEQLSQRELAKAMKLSPATVAVSLKSLERSGYVLREVDPRDARRNVVRLTEKGANAVELSSRALHDVDELMLAGFSPEERGILSQFFCRMLNNLGGPPNCSPTCPYAPNENP